MSPADPDQAVHLPGTPDSSRTTGARHDSDPASLPAAPEASDARRALLAAILLGILADPLLRNGLSGLGTLVWITLLAAVVILLTRRAARPLSRESIGWLVTAALSAAALSWRDAAMLQLFDILGMLAALVLLAMTIGGVPAAGIASARIRDLTRAAFETGLEVATGAVPLLLRDAQFQSALPASSHGQVRKVGRAVLIAAPIVLVFALLLTRADPVFGSYFSLLNFDLEVAASHILIACFFAWVVAGWLRRAFRAHPVDDTPRPTQFPLSLGATDVIVSLGALNILFAVFILAQLGWLFGGEALVLRTTGLTYAEYARRGFFELMWVAGLLLPVILATRALIPSSASRTLAIHRWLALALSALLGAILLSAAARMRLYLEYYGMSTDRLYATMFMIWIAILFAWLALTVLRSRPRTFAAGAVISGYLVLFALHLMNPDALVARSNLTRGENVKSGSPGADLRYLASLGGDAVPILVASLVAPGGAMDAATIGERCNASRTLLEKWTDSIGERPHQSWTRWNLARARATRTVLAHEAALRRLACPGGTS